MNVSSTLEPYAGSRPGRVQGERNHHTRHRRDHEVQHHCPGHDRAERVVGIQRDRDEADDDSPDRSVEQADEELLVQQSHRAGAAYLIARQRPNHDRHRLIAGVAADARDDRHQRGKRRQIANRVLELTDHA